MQIQILDYLYQKQDFIRLVRFCVEFGAIEFEGIEYKQINATVYTQKFSSPVKMSKIAKFHSWIR